MISASDAMYKLEDVKLLQYKKKLSNNKKIQLKNNLILASDAMYKLEHVEVDKAME